MQVQKDIGYINSIFFVYVFCLDPNCVGSWGDCSNGATCIQTFLISREATNVGAACEAANGDVQTCPDSSNCGNSKIKFSCKFAKEIK